MKALTKVLSLITAGIMLLSLCSCDTLLAQIAEDDDLVIERELSEAEKALGATLDAIRAFDVDSIGKHIGKNVDETDLAKITDVPGGDKVLELSKRYLSNLDYRINGIVSETDSEVTVSADIIMLDSGKIIGIATKRAALAAIEFKNAETDEEKLDIAIKVVKQIMEDLEKEKRLTTPVEVRVYKNEQGEWIVDPENKELIDACSGGAIKILEQLSALGGM